MNNVTLLKHPVVSDRLTTLRHRDTEIELFRRALRELGFFLAMEATSKLPLVKSRVVTPLGIEVDSEELDSAKVLLAPILRAGLGFVESFLELVPRAKIAHIGISRDHDTLKAMPYLNSLPGNPEYFDAIFMLDPMLATGNSAVKALEILTEGGFKPEKIILVCAFAVQEGIKQVYEKFPAVHIVTATVDWSLNDLGYIVPGLGDAGDRLYLI
ncbi:uracil phosphoribosyltransferase [Desulfolucanica intricata]|uniref:uracil phosphoribosyltransferase n=1 Tax=Desulfolucanica intricata TaxID=1285191 RepID=UPI00082AD05F|nr:uracil phosphoribosyltransferase [Desulfolucanica intricata]